MSRDADVEERFGRFVEHHVLHGTRLTVEALADGRPDLVAPLQRLIDHYFDLSTTLDRGPFDDEPIDEGRHDGGGALPAFEGFRTIERVGGGGMGQVYKLQDLTLDRVVAAKVVRFDRRGAARADFLREARAMALFSDRRIVQVFEYRESSEPPVIIMEFVDGFELGRVAPSLEFRQRAAILREVCDAIHHAHLLGLQHRDLKPSNIMLDARLSPKILDFGLSAGDPSRGHLMGTPHYLAPEQLDPSRAIDARTDVYALGVILYQLLCGAAPYDGRTMEDVLEAIETHEPRLPVELDARVPEPLQAIALKAMSRRPEDRYASAREMALDLDRYLQGLPVLARPAVYATTLGARVRPHVDHIEEWRRLNLIYPHEAQKLRAAYRELDAREDDWIVESRSLSWSQIVLYLGAFLLVAGSLFYFGAHRFHDAVRGLARPFVVLALPFIGLNLAGRYLYQRQHQAVAVALYVAGVGLLPLFLLIVFHETGWWVAARDAPLEIFSDGAVSNRQLQVTILLACAWSGWLSLRTKTVALSTVFTVLLLLLALAILGDFGLRTWLDDGRFDRLAFHLAPLVAVYAVAGWAAERSGRSWSVRPLYFGAAVAFVAVLDLAALDGRLFQHLGVSLRALQPATVSEQTRLDTLAALTLNGLAFYACAAMLDRRGSDLMKATAWLLFTIAPFSILEPIGYLSETAEYSPKVDWLYLALAVGIALASHERQRKSFYYAGLLNLGVALYLVADHRDWFDKPVWAMVLIGCGLAALALGYTLDRRRRVR